MSTERWSDWKALAWIAGSFAVIYNLPVGTPRFDHAVSEGLQLSKWYAREHMALCVVPALFIAGAIGVFVSQNAVMRHLGAGANKIRAYGVAAVSGTILAVCSCTVLPLFAGIWKRGAGLGPATAFLYSGPAINVLAIILTARVLGLPLGIARVVSAVGFSVIVGLLMHGFFRSEEAARAALQKAAPIVGDEESGRSLGQTGAFFASMIAILVFANWAKGEGLGWWASVHAAKWWITAGFGLLLALMLVRWIGVSLWKVLLLGAAVALCAVLWPVVPELAFSAGTLGLGILGATTEEGEMRDWFEATWAFAKQIIPLLLGGVMVAGFLLGRPGEEGLIPGAWISSWVGGNSLGANAFASVSGAFMYFATLTEIPILQGLRGSGMGKGPALALLLAGPALSLPSILVLNSVMGYKKTLTFVGLTVVMATICGWFYGAVWG
ncbi:MAG: permease [Planctomycetes bacterium]|nr:permease [Planctomycetota bacterium]